MDFISGVPEEKKIQSILEKMGQFHFFIDNLQNFMIVTIDFVPLLNRLVNSDQYLWVLGR